VLSDTEYRSLLAERSRHAQEKYFSWRAIATKYAETLRPADGNVVRIPAQNADG